MMKLLNVLSVVCLVAALSGCVNYGNTHALVTPVGAVGYHTFKPRNRAPAVTPPPNPNRLAVTNDQNELQDREGET